MKKTISYFASSLLGEIETFILFYRFGKISFFNAILMWFSTLRDSTVTTRTLFKTVNGKILAEILTIGPSGDRKINDAKKCILDEYYITDIRLNTNLVYRRNVSVQFVDSFFTKKALKKFKKIANETGLVFVCTNKITIGNSFIQDFFKNAKKTPYGYEVTKIYFISYVIWRNSNPLSLTNEKQYEKMLKEYQQKNGMLKTA